MKISLEEVNERFLVIPPNQEIDFLNSEFRSAINMALETLLPREAAILKMRFKYGMTLRDIANYFKVSAERVRQIESKGLRKLRNPTIADRLTPFLR
jgi:RNA polymerase primary sigma factor